MVGPIVIGIVVMELLGAKSVPEKTIGRVVMLRGGATVRHAHRSAKAEDNAIQRGDWLHQGDVIVTAKDGAVRLYMEDKSLLGIGPGSITVLSVYDVKPQGKVRTADLKVWAGGLWAKVTKLFAGQETKFDVFTPNAVAGVRGTEFFVDVNSKGETAVTVVTGQVEVGALQGYTTQMLGALQQSIVNQTGELKVVDITPEKVQQLHHNMQNSGQAGGENPADQGQNRSKVDRGGEKVKKNGKETEKEKSDTQDRGGKENPNKSQDGQQQGNHSPPEQRGFDGHGGLNLDPGAGRARVRIKVEVGD